MAYLKNIEPKNNPIAIKIALDTVINNVSLNPPETYDVSIKPIVRFKGANVKINNTINPNIKYISLTENINATVNYYNLKFYLPLYDNGTTIYIVPTTRDTNYEDNMRDLTSIDQLSIDYISGTINPDITSWSMALEYFIYETLGFKDYSSTTDSRPFPSKTTKLTKTINLSVKGIDTNRADEGKIVNVNLLSMMKRFGS